MTFYAILSFALFLVLLATSSLLESTSTTSTTAEDVLCPISLTNADGQQLTLLSTDIKVAIHGPLALIDVTMGFKNPYDREMEGKFLFLLPPDATVSRFSKTMFGVTLEGEVVERQHARNVYRQILHTPKDPALLQQDQGNRFSTRVYPIPARAEFTLLLSFSQLIPLRQGRRELLLPLVGLPKMNQYSLSAFVMPMPNETVTIGSPLQQGGDQEIFPAPGEERVYRFHETSNELQPQRDLRVNILTSEQSPKEYVLQSGNFLMTAVTPDVPKPGKPNDAVIMSRVYVDTSARLDALQVFLDSSPNNFRIHSATAFDIEQIPIPLSEGNPSEAEKRSTLLSAIRQRRALGATNLEQVLRSIGEEARRGVGQSHFLLITDGIPTCGCSEISWHYEALGPVWPAEDTLQILVVGNKMDETLLKAIAHAGRGRVIKLPLYQKRLPKQTEMMAERCADAWQQLLAPVGSSYDLKLVGTGEEISGYFPLSFPDVRTGDELIWFTFIKPEAAGVGCEGLASVVALRQNIVGQQERVFNLSGVAKEVVPQFAPLLKRLAGAAYLTYLETRRQQARNAQEREKFKQDMVQASVSYRVLCAHTAMLVLENEWDYPRWNIDRRALADILTVGDSGVKLVPRSDMKAKVYSFASGTWRETQEKKVPTPEAGVYQADDLCAKPLFSDTEQAESLLVSGLLVSDTLSIDDLPPLQAVGARGDPSSDQLWPSFPIESDTPASESYALGINTLGEADGSHTFSLGTGTLSTGTAAFALGVNTISGGISSFYFCDSSYCHDSAKGGKNSMFPDPIRRPDWAAAPPPLMDAQVLATKVKGDPSIRETQTELGYTLAQELVEMVYAWLPYDPENTQAFEFLGTAAHALGDKMLAIRAFSSIAEVAPSEASQLERAAYMMLTISQPIWAEYYFHRSINERNDNPNTYRGLALAYWAQGNHDLAAKVLENALANVRFHWRYGEVRRVLQEELAYIYRSWSRAGESEFPQSQVDSRALAAGVTSRRDFTASDGLRVTLSWETDATNLDLHVVDVWGNECYAYDTYIDTSGMRLLGDVQQGLGPEVIRAPLVQHGHYSVGVQYKSSGPMGASRGIVVLHRNPKMERIVWSVPSGGLLDAQKQSELPMIIPFTLLPSNREVQHLFSVEFGDGPCGPTA